MLILYKNGRRSLYHRNEYNNCNIICPNNRGNKDNKDNKDNNGSIDNKNNETNRYDKSKFKS